NAVTGCVSDADRDLAVRQELPVKVVAAGLISGLVPARDLEVVELRWTHGHKALLDRACKIEIVVDLFELALEFGFTQRGAHVTANLLCDCGRDDAGEKDQCRVNDIDGEGKSLRRCG